MPGPFLALITPVSPGRPAHPIAGPPEWGGDVGTPPVGGYPSLPAPPLGIWGGGDVPFPTPPIYITIPPGVIEGPPPLPTHPIWLPVFPAHPIVIPPGAIRPDPPLPTHPIVLPPIIWGPNDPRPTPPIYLPPGSLGGGQPTHPIYLPPVIWGPPDPMPTPPIYMPGGPGNPIPPVEPGVPEAPMAYPISIYAHVPGIGVVGPVTVHYPGPVPSHPLPTPEQQGRRG